MKKAARIVGIIAVIALIIAAIAASMNNRASHSGAVWDQATTVGNPNAKNYFIIYSDIVCPYCVAFENAIFEHEEEFQKYIADHDILVEIRLSDFLYEYGESNPISSRYSALGTYCAKKENKFWDYYEKAITTVWNDYFKTSGKSAFRQINSLPKDYWINLGKQVGLGDDFANCVENEETLPEIKETAKKTAKLISGMPYFKFNNFTSSGFDLSAGWDYVLMYFQAGLES